MGVAEALQDLLPETPERSSVQTPRRSGAETVRRSDIPTPKRSAVETARHSDAQTPKRSGLALQGAAKSQHPDFAKKTLYIRKTTMRDAMRKYEDQGGDEESELVELLLGRYAAGKVSLQ